MVLPFQHIYLYKFIIDKNSYNEKYSEKIIKLSSIKLGIKSFLEDLQLALVFLQEKIYYLRDSFPLELLTFFKSFKQSNTCDRHFLHKL